MIIQILKKKTYLFHDEYNNIETNNLIEDEQTESFYNSNDMIDFEKNYKKIIYQNDKNNNFNNKFVYISKENKIKKKKNVLNLHEKKLCIKVIYVFIIVNLINLNSNKLIKF